MVTAGRDVNPGVHRAWNRAWSPSADVFLFPLRGHLEAGGG